MERAAVVAYRETVPSTVIAVLLSVPAVALWLLLAAQLLGAPLGGEAAPLWLLLALALVMSAAARWFRALEVRLDHDGVSVAYGPFRARRAWRDVSHLECDEAGGFYGGYGVRFGWRQGRLVWVFSTIGTAQVVVVPSSPRGLVFSTQQPAQVLAEAQRYLDGGGAH